MGTDPDLLAVNDYCRSFSLEAPHGTYEIVWRGPANYRGAGVSGEARILRFPEHGWFYVVAGPMFWFDAPEVLSSDDRVSCNAGLPETTGRSRALLWLQNYTFAKTAHPDEVGPPSELLTNDPPVLPPHPGPEPEAPKVVAPLVGFFTKREASASPNERSLSAWAQASGFNPTSITPPGNGEKEWLVEVEGEDERHSWIYHEAYYGDFADVNAARWERLRTPTELQAWQQWRSDTEAYKDALRLSEHDRSQRERWGL